MDPSQSTVPAPTRVEERWRAVGADYEDHREFTDESEWFAERGEAVEVARIMEKADPGYDEVFIQKLTSVYTIEREWG